MDQNREFSGLSRRNLLKEVALLAVGSAAVTAFSGCSAETKSTSGTSQSKEVDVLVIGAGLGGLIAAASAAEQGASVLLIEASTRVGSTALMCSGNMTTHGSNSVPELQENAPLTDPLLGQAFLDVWPQLFEWMDSIGAPYSKTERKTETGSYSVYLMGAEPAPKGNIVFAQFFKDYATGLGVEIMLQTKGKSLITDEDGVVVGANVLEQDGTNLKVKAKNTILACGGTQNNKEMNVKYISRYADLMVSRGNPHDAGTGLLMALEVGGVPSRSHGTFYGHPVPYGIEVTQDRTTWDDNITDDEWIAKVSAIFTASQNSGGGYGVIVNMEGKRFFDESRDDLLLNQAIAQQTFARAYEIIDADIRTNKTGTSAMANKEYIDLMVEWGATVFQADTLEELASALAADGVHKANVLSTIKEYNAAVEAGTTADLDVPKSGISKASKLATGPFYAFAVVPGYSYSFGGVQVSENGQVVDADYDPIPGLWAIPGTAGGMQYDVYIGVLSTITAMARAVGAAVGVSSSSN